MRAINQPGRTTGDRTRITRGLLIFLTLTSAVLAAGCNQTGDSWERIQKDGILRIGIDPTFPPFAVDREGLLEGIDVDLSRTLADEMGLEPQFSYFGYDGLYDALTTGQVDVLVSALVITPERTKEIAYTTPYFDAGLVFVMPRDHAGGTSINELENLTLSVELGALGHLEALEQQRQFDNLTVQTHNSAADALTAVMTGEADIALVDHVSARVFLKEVAAGDSDLVMFPDPTNSEPYAVAIRIEDRILLTELNEALDRMRTSGRLNDIIDIHLGP